MSENTQGLISGLTDSINSIISEIGQNRTQKDNERMILAKSDISADEAKDKGLSVAPAWDIQRAKRREERKSKREDRKYYQSRYTHRWLNNLQQQCKKQKEINQKAIEYIKERFYFNEENGEYSLLHTFDKCNVKELLDILNEVSK